MKIKCWKCGGDGYALIGYWGRRPKLIDCYNCNGVGYLEVIDERKISKPKKVKSKIRVKS